MKCNRTTPELRKRIIAMSELGWGCKRVANYFGISHDTVRNVRIKAGFRPRNAPKHPNNEPRPDPKEHEIALEKEIIWCEHLAAKMDEDPDPDPPDVRVYQLAYDVDD